MFQHKELFPKSFTHRRAPSPAQHDLAMPKIIEDGVASLHTEMNTNEFLSIYAKDHNQTSQFCAVKFDCDELGSNLASSMTSQLTIKKPISLIDQHRINCKNPAL